MKLDVDIAELQALQGARGLLEGRKIARFLMEFGQTTFDQGNRPEQIDAFIREVGYSLRNLIAGDPVFPGGRSAETAQFAMLLTMPA